MREQDKLIEKTVIVTTRASNDFGNWGIVKFFDGEDYHVAMNNSDTAHLVFSRAELRVLLKPQPDFIERKIIS